jgi:drug/metabolite transporter (DMT)-like permease
MSNFLGEFLSVSCAFMWAIAVILFRVAGLTLSAWSLNLFKNLVGSLFFLLTFFALSGLDWPDIPTRDLLILVFSGILGIAIADTLYLRALNLLGPSRHAILHCLFSPFVILLSFTFLGERLLWLQGAGFLLILTGVILVNLRKPRREIRVRALELGLVAGVLAEFFMAGGIVLTKPIVTEGSPLFVAGIRLFGGTAGMLIWSILGGPSLRSSLGEFQSKTIPWRVLLIGSVLGTYLSMIVWIAGYKYTQASVAAILNQTSVIFIILLAAVFLKEHVSLQRWIGTLLGLAGVVLIVLAGSS